MLKTARGRAVASFGTFFSMPWRLLAFPIATGMVAHAARWALISVTEGSPPTGRSSPACTSAFNAATGLVELVSIGPSALAALLTSIAANGATAFLIIMAMTFGLILPRVLLERILPAPE